MKQYQEKWKEFIGWSTGQRNDNGKGDKVNAHSH